MRLKTCTEPDGFAVIVFCIVLGVLVLQIGFAVASLERRVTALEAATKASK